MLTDHFDPFNEAKTSIDFVRPGRFDDISLERSEVLQSFMVAVLSLVIAAGLWVAVAVAYYSPKVGSLPVPDPRIVSLLNRTYFSINGIRYLNDSTRVEQLLNEWEGACQDWAVHGVSDAAAAEVFSSISINLHRACSLHKPESADPVELIEYNALRRGFLNGAVRNAERIRKMNLISFSDAHGSSQFLSTATEFLKDVSRILTAMRELRATEPSYEAINAIKQMHEQLPESFFRIPATSESASAESQEVEKLFLLVSTALKDYEVLCPANGLGRDHAEERAETARRFYEDLRTAEELLAMTENDVICLTGIATFSKSSNQSCGNAVDTSKRPSLDRSLLQVQSDGSPK